MVLASHCAANVVLGPTVVAHTSANMWRNFDLCIDSAILSKRRPMRRSAQEASALCTHRPTLSRCQHGCKRNFCPRCQVSNVFPTSSRHQRSHLHLRSWRGLLIAWIKKKTHAIIIVDWRTVVLSRPSLFFVVSAHFPPFLHISRGFSVSPILVVADISINLLLVQRTLPDITEKNIFGPADVFRTLGLN